MRFLPQARFLGLSEAERKALGLAAVPRPGVLRRALGVPVRILGAVASGVAGAGVASAASNTTLTNRVWRATVVVQTELSERLLLIALRRFAHLAGGDDDDSPGTLANVWVDFLLTHADEGCEICNRMLHASHSRTRYSSI